MNESFAYAYTGIFYNPEYIVCTSAIFTIKTTTIISTINNITGSTKIIYQTLINYFDSQHEHYLTAVKAIVTSITLLVSILLQVKL